MNVAKESNIRAIQNILAFIIVLIFPLSIQAEIRAIGEVTAVLDLVGDYTTYSAYQIGDNWTSGQLEVTDGSEFNVVRAQLSVGERGANGQLSVASGGVVSAYYVYIGSGYGTDNTATVTGIDSLLSSDRELVVGAGGAGNLLAISAGGSVVSKDGFVGKEASSSNNIVTITGEGSSWSVTDDLSVGIAGNSGNTLRLEEGGKLTASSLAVAANNTLSLSSGQVDLNGGLFSLDGTLVMGGVGLSGQSVSVVNGDLKMGADAVMEFYLFGSGLNDRLSVSGNLTLDGTLSLVFGDGYTPVWGDSYDLFDAGSISDVGFDITNLPALDDGLEWDYSKLLSSGVITVIPEPVAMMLLLVAGVTLLVGRRVFRL